MAEQNYKTTEAHRARSKRWYEEHKQRSAEIHRQYYVEHREELNAYKREWERKRKELEPPKPRLTPEERLERKREYTRRWRAANPDAASRNSKRWREENWAKYVAEREKRAEQARQYRAANLEKAREGGKQWKENNPEKIRAYNRNRKARLASKDGQHTASDIEMLYRSQQGWCAGCNAVLQRSGPERFHVDHIVPLFPKDGSRPGSNGPENLQLLCPRCNLSKSNLSQEQWDRREGRLLH